MKKTLLLIWWLACASAGMAQHTNQYCNSAFAFCIQIPGNFDRKGETMEGYGQYFTSKDGSRLAVFGTFNSLGETLKQRLEREQNALTNDSTLTNTTQLPTIQKAELQENSFLLVYQHKEQTTFIFRKLAKNEYINVEMTYPTAKAKDYEAKAKAMIGNLR